MTELVASRTECILKSFTFFWQTVGSLCCSRVLLVTEFAASGTKCILKYLILFPDGRQVLKDAAAYKLPDEVHAAGRANLHRNLQGLRQTHEPHTGRLRRIQESQTQEGEGRTGREASFRLGSIHTQDLFGVNNSLNKGLCSTKWGHSHLLLGCVLESFMQKTCINP